MAECKKMQVWVNTSDLHCSVCHDPLFSAVALPCMHRFCDKCVFFLDKCALCRKPVDSSEVPAPDHFIQTLARDNVKELPLCGAGEALSYQENVSHRQQCIICLQTWCAKQEENIRSIKNRCYHLLSEEVDSDSGDDSDEPVIRLHVRGRNGSQ